MGGEGPPDRPPPPPPPPEPPPDYSAVNEPIRLDLTAVREIEPVHRDQPQSGEADGMPEQVTETADTTPPPPDYSAVNEPIAASRVESTAEAPSADQTFGQDPNSDYDAARGEEAMKKWESSQDQMNQDTADYLDSEAARLREAGDESGADATQAAADKARSLIGSGAEPNGGDAPPAPTEAPEAATADLGGENTSEVGTDDGSGGSNGGPPDSGGDAGDNGGERDLEQRWMDDADTAELEDFRADAYKRLDENLALEQSSRLGGAIDAEAEAKADAAADAVKKAQADIDAATERINRPRYSR